jgi:two-component system chemotaxis response regulator CheY
MPNLDGYKLIKTIREDPEYIDLPIIILSSLSRDEDINEGMSAGANSYLIKPFNTKRIQYEVAKYIG